MWRAAVHPHQRRPSRPPPHPYLTRGGACYQEAPVATQRHADREIESLGQHGLGEVGPRQARVLRLYARQVGLPNRQATEVPTAQVTMQQPQQVHDIARTIALLRFGAIPPTLE